MQNMLETSNNAPTTAVLDQEFISSSTELTSVNGKYTHTHIDSPSCNNM
jgi:hypothetical protein